jgi:hypothetical protein
VLHFILHATPQAIPCSRRTTRVYAEFGVKRNKKKQNESSFPRSLYRDLRSLLGYGLRLQSL